MYQHQDDTHGGRWKGAHAQSVFRKTFEHYGCKVEKTALSDDVKGIDYLVRTHNGYQTSFAVSGHFDKRFSKEYLRVCVGSIGNANISSIFNSTADAWAYYNPRYDERKFLTFDIDKCREYLMRNYGRLIQQQHVAMHPQDAIDCGVLYQRTRYSQNTADLILYVPISRVEPYANIIDIPEEALPGIEV